ncbi:MAG: NTP transferase domain-containing protein [Alphaproteobacteria bacterium]|nr:NTP transferase domain-containing protein [Alphaproteobacteria bacterium]
MIGVVLAGGASTRFGGAPKGLALLKGRAMALYVADILGTLCDRVLIEAPRAAGYEALGLPLVHAAPEHAGKGPLAAIAAGLAASGEDDRVAFAPCDMPLLTAEIYRRLIEARGVGAYARTPQGVEPLVAVLSAGLRPQLLTALKDASLPRTHAVLDAAGARAVDFANVAAFANVNEPADLSRIEAMLGT